MAVKKGRNMKFSNFMKCYHKTTGSEIVRFDMANQLYEDEHGHPGYLDIRIFEGARSMHLDDSTPFTGSANKI